MFFTNAETEARAGPRTLNHYLQGMISFLNWLERGERIKFNPLKNVGKVDERGQKKRKRRAFTDEELRKLMVGSGERGLIYFTAARTGLRWDELRQLKWNEVKLEAATPIIIVREETAKNKTEEPVCLVTEIVEALKAHRPGKWSSTGLVFPQGIPRNRRLQKDAQANGIVYQDEQGRYADFHSLRYTFATFMHRNGMPANFVRKQMRHKTLRQTDGYTDEMQLPIYESIKNLPRLGGCTQIRAQISGAEGQNGAQPVASNEGVKPHGRPANGGFWPVLSLPVATSEMERVKGIEPSFRAWEAHVLPLNHTRIAEPRNQCPRLHKFLPDGRPAGNGSVSRIQLRNQPFSEPHIPSGHRRAGRQRGARVRRGGAEERLKLGEQVLGQPFGLLVGAGAAVKGLSRHQKPVVLIHDAMAEIQAHPLDAREPDFDGEQVVVAGRGLVTHPRFNDGKNIAGRLQFQDGMLEGAHEFAAGGFEQIQIAGMVNVVAHGAVGVGDAVGVAERFYGHARSIKPATKSSTSKAGGTDEREDGKTCISPRGSP